MRKESHVGVGTNCSDGGEISTHLEKGILERISPCLLMFASTEEPTTLLPSTNSYSLVCEVSIVLLFNLL